MRFVLGLVLGAVIVGASRSALAQEPTASIPAYLVGEWVTDSAEFRNEALWAGGALYLDSDGLGASLGAPPPIGVWLRATYDSVGSYVTATLYDGDQIMAVVRIDFDARAGTLRAVSEEGSEEIYRRRRDRVPAYVRHMICEIRVKPVECP